MAGIAESHLVFDRFMTLFSASLKKSLTLHAPNCTCLCQEELFFVCLVADMQNDRVARATANLEIYLAATGVRLSLDALKQLSSDFADAGILLDHEPNFDPRRHAQLVAERGYDSVDVTVH